MGWQRRVTWSLTVLSGGILAALPFYRGGGVSSDVPVMESKPAGATTDAMALQIIADPSGEKSLRGEDGGERGHSHVDTPPAVSAAPILASSPEAPRIAAEFPAATSQVPSIQDIPSSGSNRFHGNANQRPDGSSNSPRVARSNPRGEDSADPQDGDGPRIHRIRDGDTLQRIAQRYLGSADRWSEILAVNRDVFQNPEMLPVGKEIRIPPRIASGEKGPVPVIPAEPPITTLVPIP